MSEQASEPTTAIGPPTDHSASMPAVRAVERAVEKLEFARSSIERDLERNYTDIREIRDRLAATENSSKSIDGKLEKLLAAAAAAEVRLASIDIKLEAKAGLVDVGKLDTSLATISTKIDAKAAQADLSEIKGKIEQFVDKWFVLKTCLWSFGAVATFITAVAVFQDKIRAYLGVH